MSEPTARQREIYEAVKRLGNNMAAGDELGISRNAIYKGLNAYIAATGAERPSVDNGYARLGASLRARSLAIRQTPERLSAIEQTVAELVRVSERLVDQAERFEELLTAFCARQPVILGPARDALVPSHRRLADGGVGGRREARG